MKNANRKMLVSWMRERGLGLSAAYSAALALAVEADKLGTEAARAAFVDSFAALRVTVSA